MVDCSRHYRNNCIKMKYFKIQELVSKRVYRRYGDDAIKFICPMLLETISAVRENIGKPITINNWHLGGRFHQRGLRENTSSIVKSNTNRDRLYLSAHVMGKAIDFDVQGMTANEVRKWLVDNQSILPYKIRLENKLKGNYISWVHLDIFQEENNAKVYLFDV